MLCLVLPTQEASLPVLTQRGSPKEVCGGLCFLALAPHMQWSLSRSRKQVF